MKKIDLKLLGVALIGGLWLSIPIALVAARSSVTNCVVAVAALSGVVAAGIAFFIGMSAGARLPKID